MLRIENLSKVFRTEEVETTALNSVSLHIKEGEFVAIMGPSGCGLLDNPTSGQYYFDGKEVGALKERQRTMVRKGNIGFVFQSFNLIDELNVYENIELPLIYLKLKASERKEKVNQILDRMKISHRAKHFPQQLSGGQQQLVAIARAVVAGPKLILADEPTGNLDNNNAWEIMKLMEEINNNGTTVVVVTHNLEIVKAMNKRVITMQKGVIVDDSDTASSIVTGDNAISRSLTERDVLKREGDYDYED